MGLICSIELVVDGKLDPDDARSVEEQAEEYVDGLVYWINDSCPGVVWAEVVVRG